MNKLTVIIPTLNEEEFLEGAINSAKFADEIIVMDSFSKDNTVKIATEHSVKVIQREFDNFSAQKNYAIDKAQNNWIFILDADERIPEALKNEIIDRLKNPEDYVAFYVLCSHIFMNKRMKHSTFKNEWKMRFFNKEYCKYGSKLVHEDVDVHGKSGKLKNHFDHYTYRNFDHYVGKKNHYAYLQAKSLHAKNKKPNAFHFIIKPGFRFFNQFILKGGFKDGFPGFVSAYINSYGVMVRYLKLYLMNRNLK